MSNIDPSTQKSRNVVATISKADRDALLRMLAEKPSVIIDNALRESQRRGIFTGYARARVRKPRSSYDVLRSTILVVMLAALGALAYERTADRFAVFTKPHSVTGITPDDIARAAAKKLDEKDEVVVARLSQPVRNALKSYLPDATNGNGNRSDCILVVKKEGEKTAITKHPGEWTNQWAERMIALHKAGRTNELRAELQNFRRLYPSVALPAALQTMVC
jgi:hypothetical protein